MEVFPQFGQTDENTRDIDSISGFKFIWLKKKIGMGLYCCYVNSLSLLVIYRNCKVKLKKVVLTFLNTLYREIMFTQSILENFQPWN